MSWRRIAALRTPDDFRVHLQDSGIGLAFDDELSPAFSSPFARPIEVGGDRVGNRFCILPMEGWDGTPEGEPSELTQRRWRNFGVSGAKLIWGGEAVAVRHDGRANPRQLVLAERTVGALARLRQDLVDA
ncbi:MAG TPA: NADH:flavin oxidoreductase, partial [Vicinamibacteria bacterium]|nr:NADH:flavin oxidoreductase [Vicinamibacteria bacterium]